MSDIFEAMIDTHCHLEQPDYDKDRGLVLEKCRTQLNAVITSCANPKHFDLTIRLVNDYRNFLFAAVSVHPSYVKKLDDREINGYIERINHNKDNIVAIGETGLDYHWIKEASWQSKQKILFKKMINLADKLNLPLIIHSRDATEETVNILEEGGVDLVQMHMFTERSLLRKVLKNHWFISVNTLLLRSKDVKKIVRDCPLENLMLETDAPWLGIGRDGKIKPKHIVRNDPTSIIAVAEKISEIKKTDLKKVDEKTTHNAVKFFDLDLDL